MDTPAYDSEINQGRHFRMSSLETENFSEWDGLPIDLLKDIAKRLTSIQDYISFRSVCISWRSAATFDNFDGRFPQVPRLIYFVEERLEQPRVTVFLNLLTNAFKITNFPPAIDYPYLSCSGWVLCLRKNSLNVGLLHYIRRVNIHLPGLNTFPGYRQKSSLPIIRKIVLSRSTSDLMIMVIWGDAHQLAFCRPGDQSWTLMDKWGAPFSDIIYDDTKLYALDSGLRIVECDIHGSNPTKIVQVFTFPEVPFPFLGESTRIGYCKGCVVHNYLVKSSGKFLIVCRYICRDLTYCFRIYEIELNDGSYVEVKNLEGRYLFLGLNSSVCAEFPESKMKSNCIYFSNTIEQTRYPDTGVYRMCDSDIENLIPEWFVFPQPSIVVPAL